MTYFSINNSFLFEIFYNSIDRQNYSKKYIYIWFNNQHNKLKEYINLYNIYIENNQIIYIMIQLYNDQLKSKTKIKKIKSKHSFLRRTLKKIKLI